MVRSIGHLELVVKLAGNLDRVKKGLGDKSEKGNRVGGFATDNGLLTTDS